VNKTNASRRTDEKLEELVFKLAPTPGSKSGGFVLCRGRTSAFAGTPEPKGADSATCLEFPESSDIVPGTEIFCRSLFGHSLARNTSTGKFLEPAGTPGRSFLPM
jgi:hypothetical protein